MPYKLESCHPVIGGKNEYYELPGGSIVEIKAVQKKKSLEGQFGSFSHLMGLKSLAELEKAELKIVKGCVPTYELNEIMTKYVEEQVRVMKTTRRIRDGFFELAMVDKDDHGKFLGYVQLPDGKEITPKNVALAYIDQTGALTKLNDTWVSFTDLCKAGYVDTSDYVLFTEPFFTGKGLHKAYAAIYVTYPQIVQNQGNAMPDSVEKAEEALAETFNRIQDSLDGIAYIATLYSETGELRSVRNEKMMISRDRIITTNVELKHIGSFNNINEAIEHLKREV